VCTECSALLAAHCACSQSKALTVSGDVSFFASHVSTTSRSYVWPSAAHTTHVCQRRLATV
jgi:hypothetical protein